MIKTLFAAALAVLVSHEATAFVPVPAYYVSTLGSDSNPGTLALPFATLNRARNAMRSGAIKTTYVRAGNYSPTATSNCDGGGGNCGLNLLSPFDDGETWSAYPPDGYGKASINGRSTGVGTGLMWVVYVGANHITINGLATHNFQYAGIGSTGGVTNLLVKNSYMYNGYQTGNGNPAGFSCYGCANTTISHNVVHDIAEFGISFGQVNGDISNLLVNANYIYNTCTKVSDCGAIYVLDSRASAKNIRWVNNYIHDGNLAAPFSQGGGGGSALYADDCSSNIVMRGNIISGRNGSNTIHYHGGSNIQVVHNLIDLATYQMANAVFQTADGTSCNASGPMTGNTYKGNIVVSAGGGGGYYLMDDRPTGSPGIANNAYHNYAGTQIKSDGDYRDTNPVQEDPQISGWNYLIASTSPVWNAPVSFSPLISNWGPIGFVVPKTGTPPSVPH